MSRAAVGLRAHSGWAAAVTVGGEATAPVLLDRRRLALADDATPRPVQPYHASEGLRHGAALGPGPEARGPGGLDHPGLGEQMGPPRSSMKRGRPVGQSPEMLLMRYSMRFLVPLLTLVPFVVSARADEPIVATAPAPAGLVKAAFAGGCFWCMQRPYDDLPGVVSTTVGYTGGEKANPTYHEVSAGGTGHRESIEVVYDPKKVTYEKLLDVLWHNVDPTNEYGQFCDNGSQYRTAIFVADDAQRKAAEASKRALEASGILKRPIVTEILKAGTFWKAEDYHQSYYKKNPIRYSFYRSGCGRDARLKELWGDAAPKH